MVSLFLVSAQVAAKYKPLTTDITLIGSLVIVHSQMVPQVAHFFKLSAAATVLADKQLLAAVRVEVDPHYFVVLGKGLHRLNLYVAILGSVLI